MGLYYKSNGMTLWDGLQKLYEKYGYIGEDVFSFTLEGRKVWKNRNIMQKLRDDKGLKIEGYQIVSISDYLSGEKYNILSNSRETFFTGIKCTIL